MVGRHHRVFDKISGIVNGWFDNALKTLSEKGNVLSQVFILLYGVVQYSFNNIVGAIRTALSLIKAIFETLAAVVYGFATGDWSAALDKIKSAWIDVWVEIKRWGASLINSILGTVEAFVNGVITMFNNLVGAFSSVLQFFGGGGINWRASSVSIPRLAKGGIVKRVLRLLPVKMARRPSFRLRETHSGCQWSRTASLTG